MDKPQLSSRMGTAAIPTLLWKTSIPLMLSLMVNSLYNVVDSIFVSRINEDALTALSLASPVQMMMSSLGCGIAVGLNAAISKAMGEKNREKVAQTASASIFLALCAYALIAAACLLLAKPYFAWQSADSSVIAAHGYDYLSVCMLFSFGQMGQWVFDRFLIATGRSSLFLATLSFASVINLILDPIFIFGLLGFPAMGTRGAAIATVCGQLGGAILGVVLNLRHNREIPIRFTLRVKFKRIADILRVGVPTALMQGIVAGTGIVWNLVLQGFSTTAVAVFGVCNRIQGLMTIGPHGVNNGLIPIVAYNYGARRRDRVEQCIRYALLDSLLLMGITLIVMEVFPVPILRLFDASQTMLQLGVPALRIFAVAYLLSVIGMVYSTVFQALGQGSLSMYLTMLRQVVLPVLFVWVFAGTGRIELVWLAFLLSEALSIPFALLLMRRVKRRIIAPIAQEPPAEATGAL